MQNFLDNYGCGVFGGSLIHNTKCLTQAHIHTRMRPPPEFSNANAQLMARPAAAVTHRMHWPSTRGNSHTFAKTMGRH